MKVFNVIALSIWVVITLSMVMLVGGGERTLRCEAAMMPAVGCYENSQGRRVDVRHCIWAANSLHCLAENE